MPSLKNIPGMVPPRPDEAPTRRLERWFVAAFCVFISSMGLLVTPASHAASGDAWADLSVGAWANASAGAGAWADPSAGAWANASAGAGAWADASVWADPRTPQDSLRVAASNAGLRIVDFLPRDADRKAIRQSIARALGRSVVLADPNEILIEAVRWSRSDPARAVCETQRFETTEFIRAAGWVPPPSENEPLLGPLVHQAGEQFAFLDLQGVLNSTARARDNLVCEDGIVSRDNLVRLLVYEALAHVYLEDGKAQAAFQTLLGIEPGFRLEEKLRSDEADRVLADAVNGYRREDVRLEKGGLEGTFHLDGRAATDLHASVGEHMVQLKSRMGEVRSRWIVIPAPDDVIRTQGGSSGNIADGPAFQTRLALSSLADFGLLSDEDARWRLRKGVGPGPFDRPLARALDAYLDRSGEMELLFAVPAVDDQARIRRYEKAGSLTDLNIGATDLELPEEYLAERSPTTGASGSSLQASLGFGVQTLLGGQDTFAASGKEAGYVLEVGWSAKRTLVTLRTALYPHIRREGDAETLCDGPGLATDVDPVVAVVACLPRSPVFSAGIGVGYYVGLPHDLLFLPVLYVEAARIPSALVETGAQENEDYLVGNALMAGTMARARLAYKITRSQIEVRSGLEVSLGLLLARGAGESIFAIPLGLTVFSGVSF